MVREVRQDNYNTRVTCLSSFAFHYKFYKIYLNQHGVFKELKISLKISMPNFYFFFERDF